MNSIMKDEVSGEYPCLMKYKYPQNSDRNESNLILLFVKESFGVIVHNDEYPDQVGRWDDSWNMDAFERFGGQITLSN